MPSASASPHRKPIVQVVGRYRRSVELRRDFDDPAALDGYLITPTVKGFVSRILQELGDPEGVRAWSVTGPYGTGKSSFALFLSRLLAKNVDAGRAGAQLLADFEGKRPLLPVLVVGQRRPLKPSLLNALQRIGNVLPDSLRRAVSEASSDPDLSDEDVAILFERTADAVRHAGYGGIAVYVDEFGKFLEHVAAEPRAQDIQVVQFLAEAATRSQSPFLFVTLLHSSFSSYVRNESDVRQAEWQKVQGRFVDLAFLEPLEQVLRLVGDAVQTDFPDDLESRIRDAILWIHSAPSWSEVRARLPATELLPDCVPLEPTAALLLGPLFRSKLAQNERSLFSFLISDEPAGLQEFVRTADWNADPPALFGLPNLYDYVSSSLGPSTYRGELARRWVEIGSALDRIDSSAPASAADVVKSIGLISMYGSHVGLRSSRDALDHALGNQGNVEEALTYLLDRSIVVYRGFQDAFGIWEGSDVDLEKRLATAYEHIRSGGLAGRLAAALSIEPVAAKAHYIESGTLRYFDVEVIDGSSNVIRHSLDGDVGGADGCISYVLCDDAREREHLLELATEWTADPAVDLGQHVLAFPSSFVGLEAALTEYEAWRWVRDNTPSLAGDSVASREVTANLEVSQRRLEQLAGGVFGLRGHRFDPSHCDWVHRGECLTFADSRSHARWLSSVLDNVFPLAPAFHNELLNRSKPSSAANTALNKLARLLVTNAHVAQLGIDGHPPELSMYESLIRQGGFHHHDELRQTWWLGEPNEEWLPVWHHMEAFLATTREGRRSITELFDELEKPPFGLRRGVLPVLALILMRVKRNTVALYLKGLYQPELTPPLAEQLLRNPDGFEVQAFVYDESTHSLLSELTALVDSMGQASSRSEAPVLRIAKPMIVLASRLPRYSKNTRRIEPADAIALRDQLLTARDPHELVVDELPRVMKLWPKTDEERREFISRLDASLHALQSAYPRLLERIEAQVAGAFGITAASGSDLRRSLRRRAEAVKGLATEPRLVAVINRMATLDESTDWREAVGLAVVGSRAPKDWADADADAFRVSITHIAREFQILEELAHEQGRTGAQTIVRVGVLGNGQADRAAMVSLDDDGARQVTELMDQMRDTLKKHAADDASEYASVRIAALAKLLVDELGNSEG